MADNITILDSSNTARLVRADDVNGSSVFTQVVRLDVGNDTSESLVVGALPVTGYASQATDIKITLDSEAVTVNAHAVTNAGIFAVQPGVGSTGYVRGGGAKTDTSAQAIMASAGADAFNYLCWVTAFNASSSNTYVEIKDGTTIAAVLPCPAYGGAILQPTYPLRGSSNAAWNLNAGAATTTVYLYGGGFKSGT